MSYSDIFNEKKSILLNDVISIDICKFLTHLMMRVGHENKIQNIYSGDSQVPDSLICMSHDIIFETIGERIWPVLENILGEELIPTYSYARLYTNGNSLKKHLDRESCEISVTIQLGKSHHYCWPFFAGKERFDLKEGDGVLYKGCEIPHWRDECNGPEGYYSGQVFCHFVRAKGPYSNFIGDNRWDNEIPYVRYRSLLMDKK